MVSKLAALRARLDAISVERLKTASVVTLVATILCVAAWFWWRSRLSDGFYENLLAESFGLLGDLLVFGMLLLWLETRRERRVENRAYRNEIDDFRGWQAPEAAYRIAGNIKRLNRNGETKINLGSCFLEGSSLRDVDLTGANLSWARCHGVDLQQARLTNAQAANTMFDGADFQGAVLDGTALVFSDFRGAKNLTVEQLLSASDLAGAKLDPPLKAALLKQRPNALQVRSGGYGYASPHRDAL